MFTVCDRQQVRAPRGSCHPFAPVDKVEAGLLRLQKHDWTACNTVASELALDTSSASGRYLDISATSWTRIHPTALTDPSALLMLLQNLYLKVDRGESIGFARVRPSLRLPPGASRSTLEPSLILFLLPVSKIPDSSQEPSPLHFVRACPRLDLGGRSSTSYTLRVHDTVIGGCLYSTHL